MTLDLHAAEPEDVTIRRKKRRARRFFRQQQDSISEALPVQLIGLRALCRAIAAGLRGL